MRELHCSECDRTFEERESDGRYDGFCETCRAYLIELDTLRTERDAAVARAAKAEEERDGIYAIEAERRAIAEAAIVDLRQRATLAELRRLRDERDGWRRLATGLADAVTRAADWSDGTRVGDALEAIERATIADAAARGSIHDNDTNRKGTDR